MDAIETLKKEVDKGFELLKEDKSQDTNVTV